MVRKMEGRSRIEPLFDVLRMTYVIAVCCFAQKDIDVERHAVKGWWSRWDSNPRPPRCHRGALPTAPRPHRLTATTFPVAPGRALPTAPRPHRAETTEFMLHQAELFV